MDEDGDKRGVERVLLKENWGKEASAVIKDIGCGVREAHVSERLHTVTNRYVYLNIVTMEGSTLCIEMSTRGFRVAGRRHDCISGGGDTTYYETPYALLNTVSIGFQKMFSRTLSEKLTALEKNQQNAID